MPGLEEISFEFLADNSTDVICRAGADMMLRYVSPSSSRVLGWRPEEMTGKRPDDFLLAPDAPFGGLATLSDTDQPPYPVRLRKKDGSLAWVEIRYRLVCDPATGEHTETIIILRDTTKSKMLEEQILALEMTDARTGLSTARAFDETLQSEWNRSQRDGSYISLLLLDFNHFRQFHDWRQHKEGDHCLAEAATAVIGSLRITDFAARYRAEDIAVILPSTNAEGAARVAQRVQSAVEELRSPSADPGQQAGRLHVTMGVATMCARPGATTRMPELLRLGADSALQKAKRGKMPAAPRLSAG